MQIYDTTLRDGAQCSEVNFSVDDKLAIFERLVAIGIPYIEGGWPGANPKDEEFFKKIQNSHLVAFGSTRRPGKKAEQDELLKALVNAKTSVITIFGKSWDLHVKDALNIPLEENLEIVFDSIKYLKKHVEEVFFDAEHFFDGYKANNKYALEVLNTAKSAGADCLVLCDTNGGVLPQEISVILEDLKKYKFNLGLHLHNDSDTAVASSLIGATKGVNQIQGTINGIGERCGNANLISVIADLQLKMGIQCLPKGNLKKLSAFVSEIGNLGYFRRQPFVGHYAFAHKGGIHVSAVAKNTFTYEHIDPELVGNKRKILVSDQSGKSNILDKTTAFGIKLDKNDPKLKQILNEVKLMEHQGYVFENAEASFEILVHKLTGKYKPFFELLSFHVTDNIDPNDDKAHSEATIRIRVGEREEHTAALGSGPVNALDNALRKALLQFYPQLKNVKLLDYKVRVLPVTDIEATDSVVRVWIESTDGVEKWATVGVSQNIIHASWKALVDSLEYKLMKKSF